MASHNSPGGEQGPRNHSPEYDPADDAIDLRELFLRLARGAYQILGFTLIGFAIAAGLSLFLSRVQPAVTSTRVVFSFPGFERGVYPDQSKFNPDDLRAPVVIEEALRRVGLDLSDDFQTRIRGSLSIEGIVPPNIVKERDRLRASGQTPPVYVPDEYVLSLVMKPSATFSNAQRQQLLNEIVTVYRENFYRTFGRPPLAFGTAFVTLQNADFSEYELVLNSEVATIRSYLTQQSEAARSFRSVTTNLTFKDLLEQTELFAQIQINEILGIIRQNGLSRDRNLAMLKLDYYLRLLEEREAKALEEEKVVRDLLSQSQSRTQNYVLGTAAQAQNRPDSLVLDQGLIDSLLANDSYNFLVRRALDAGLEVKRIQAEKNRLIAQRDNLKTFLEAPSRDQSEIMTKSTEALRKLETTYNTLIDNIRKTHADFSKQEYSHAIRVSDRIRTAGVLKPMVIAGVVGAVIGFALAAGLALIGSYVGPRPRQG